MRFMTHQPARFCFPFHVFFFAKIPKWVIFGIIGPDKILDLHRADTSVSVLITLRLDAANLKEKDKGASCQVK